MGSVAVVVVAVVMAVAVVDMGGRMVFVVRSGDTLVVRFIDDLRVVVWDREGVETGVVGISSLMVDVVDECFVFAFC